MCANYVPVSSRKRLLEAFGVDRMRDEPAHEVFPLGLAPFICLSPSSEGQGSVPASIPLALECLDGVFGLLPHFAAELAYGRRTYNARSETVHKLPSFRQAWTSGQRCIVPAEAIFEPCWESGKAVRWRISLPEDQPMGIAGIYRKGRHPATGESLNSFAMLTVNADQHTVMRRFHRPEDEKRMVLILRPEEYRTWLTCSVEEASSFFRMYDAALVSQPAPVTRAPRASGTRTTKRDLPGNEGLFE